MSDQIVDQLLEVQRRTVAVPAETLKSLATLLADARSRLESVETRLGRLEAQRHRQTTLAPQDGPAVFCEADKHGLCSGARCGCSCHVPELPDIHAELIAKLDEITRHLERNCLGPCQPPGSPACRIVLTKVLEARAIVTGDKP